MSPVVAQHGAHSESDMVAERRATRSAITRVGILLAGLATCIAVAADAKADEIVQGVLQLRWGDAPHVPHSRVDAHAQVEAWLDAGPGRRYRLDVEQARRAAGDLYGLSNRRVAVAYRVSSRVMAGAKASSIAPEISAIVPTDTLPSRTMAKSDASGGGTAVPLSGSTRWITVMCKFADIASEQRPRAFFQSQYGDAPGQLGHYWSEVSYGRIDLAGSAAHGWYTLPRPRAAYLSDAGGRTRADLSLLFADCAALADADVDFRGAQGVNLMFNAELDGSAWGGGACATLDGSYQCTRATWNPPWSFNNLAPLAHEMGHGYGLPHSDNSDGDGDTYDNPWDLMSDAWRMATSDVTYGLLPKHLNMYQRERLGWVAAARKRTIPANNAETHEIMLDAASLQNAGGVQLLMLALPAQADPFTTVVYTVEARRRTGTYEAALAGDAVIIHRLEDYGIARSIDRDTPVASFSSNEGSMLKVGGRWSTPDERHWIEVVARTDSGFVLRVGPRPRAMSAPTPALERSAATVASAPAAVAVRTTPATRRARPANVPSARARACEVLPRVLRLPTLCALL
ncbi:hypothetical protein [Pseudoxanthomonas mexicana]|uniref:hypothetical protein n=1 Tax=Pseudoxanthomonas mexicana TaxID=128785 RepID=UPI0012EE809C|nr:hypothetical protein [Pseudoxanthomonas mexicana]